VLPMPRSRPLRTGCGSILACAGRAPRLHAAIGGDPGGVSSLSANAELEIAGLNPDFSVVDGLVFLQQPGTLENPEMLLRLFHFIAEQGVKLSTTTEYKIEQALPSLAATPPAVPSYGSTCRKRWCSRTQPTRCEP